MTELEWHEGEHRMHILTKVPEYENPTTPFLTPRAAHMMHTAPLLALGTVDSQGRPWSTVIGGESHMAQLIGESTVGIQAVVSKSTDPVIDILTGGDVDKGLTKEPGRGKMLSGLTIDLETRRRIKLYGRMIAHDLSTMDALSSKEPEDGAAFAKLVVKMEQSMGNCPKYLNCKRIRPAIPQPKAAADSTVLSEKALQLIAKADTLFVASAYRQRDMDSNIRGGPPGFVRVEKNDEASTVLVWPEYSGNNLYQTLGNLQVSHRAGLVFPDFETGDVLYVTGDAEVLIGEAAATILSRSKLAVRLTLTGARFVEQGLGFRGELLERSPYNPKVLYLADEKEVPKTGQDTTTATMIKKERLTPTINRYRFSISDPAAARSLKPGQYVALSFEDELDIGYSHMRDDDPKSLNDDYLRTFTVSSSPGEGLHGEEFAITVRTVGKVTEFLSGFSTRSTLEIPLQGFGGEFFIEQPTTGKTVFIAGGIGITPLIPQLKVLDISRLRLIWSLHVKDIGIVYDTFKSHPALAKLTSLFLSGQVSALPNQAKAKWDQIREMGPGVYHRRLKAEDVTTIDAQAWYLCTGKPLRNVILGWLPGKTVHYEDFDY